MCVCVCACEWIPLPYNKPEIQVPTESYERYAATTYLSLEFTLKSEPWGNKSLDDFGFWVKYKIIWNLSKQICISRGPLRLSLFPYHLFYPNYPFCISSVTIQYSNNESEKWEEKKWKQHFRRCLEFGVKYSRFSDILPVPPFAPGLLPAFGWHWHGHSMWSVDTVASASDRMVFWMLNRSRNRWFLFSDLKRTHRQRCSGQREGRDEGQTGGNKSPKQLRVNAWEIAKTKYSVSLKKCVNKLDLAGNNRNIWLTECDFVFPAAITHRPVTPPAVAASEETHFLSFVFNTICSYHHANRRTAEMSLTWWMLHCSLAGEGEGWRRIGQGRGLRRIIKIPFGRIQNGKRSENRKIN